MSRVKYLLLLLVMVVQFVGFHGLGLQFFNEKSYFLGAYSIVVSFELCYLFLILLYKEENEKEKVTYPLVDG